MIDMDNWSGNGSPINLNIKFAGLGKKDKGKMRKNKSGAAIVDACKFKISNPRDYHKRHHNFNLSPDLSPTGFGSTKQLENNFIESRGPTNHPNLLSDDKDLDEETFNIVGHARDSTHHRQKKLAAPSETCHPSTGQNIINVGSIGENLIWLEQARRMTRKTKTGCVAPAEDAAENKAKAQPQHREGDEKGINLNVNINLNFNILNEYEEEMGQNQSSSKPRKESGRRLQSNVARQAMQGTSLAPNAQVAESIPLELAGGKAIAADAPGGPNERSGVALDRFATHGSVAAADNRWREAQDSIVNLPGPQILASCGGGSFFGGHPVLEHQRNHKQAYYGEGKINYNRFELRSKKSQKVIQGGHANPKIRGQRPPQASVLAQKKAVAMKQGSHGPAPMFGQSKQRFMEMLQQKRNSSSRTGPRGPVIHFNAHGVGAQSGLRAKRILGSSHQGHRPPRMEGSLQRPEELEFKIEDVLVATTNNDQAHRDAVAKSQIHQRHRQVSRTSTYYQNLQDGPKADGQAPGAAFQEFLKRRGSKQLSQQLIVDAAASRKFSSQAQIGVLPAEFLVSIKSDQHGRGQTPYCPPTSGHLKAGRPGARAVPLRIHAKYPGSASQTCCGSVKSENATALTSHNEEFINFKNHVRALGAKKAKK